MENLINKKLDAMNKKPTISMEPSNGDFINNLAKKVVEKQKCFLPREKLERRI